MGARPRHRAALGHDARAGNESTQKGRAPLWGFKTGRAANGWCMRWIFQRPQGLTPQLSIPGLRSPTACNLASPRRSHNEAG